MARSDNAKRWSTLLPTEARLLAIAAVLALASACQSEPPQAQLGPKNLPAEAQMPVESPELAPAGRFGRPVPPGELPGQGLVFRLSEADSAAAAEPPPPKAVTAPLSPAETAKLLSRLPKLVQQPADAQPFALREKSLPAPRPGETVPQPFPPPTPPDTPAPSAAQPSAAQPGPLQVLRYSPQGDVELAPRISVTFSQPMVPVTDHASLQKLPIPVVVTPMIDGEWRWLGTQTVVLQPKQRLPMATEFSVSVPAGTKALGGAELAAPLSFGFRTPPPRLLEQSPQGHGLPLQPVIFARFDQAIDPAKVLEKTELTAGGKKVAVRLLNPEELAALPGWRERVAQLQAGGEAKRWIALLPDPELPKNSQVLIKWGPGLPSAEGPRVTDKPAIQSFRTYGPLGLVQARCGWDADCPPLLPWTLEFSNPIDAKRFNPSWIRVEPPIAQQKVQVHGSVLTLSGMTRGRTAYQITVAPDLMDVYGQTLGKPATARILTTKAEPMFQMQGGPVIVLDPSAKKAQLPVWTVNHKQLRVKAWRVQPSHWQAWRQAQREASDQEAQPKPPGTPVIDRLVAISGQPDEAVETALDLSAGLQGPYGQLIVYVAPTQQPKERWNQEHFWSWVQVTQLGVTAVRDQTQLLAWASELASGKAAPGVEFELVTAKARPPQTAKSGDDGTAMLPLPEVGDRSGVLIAKRGADLAMIPEHADYYSDSSDWHRREIGPRLSWHVVDDRGLYKPGETAHFKGWLRMLSFGPRSDVGPWSGPARLFWRLRDSRGNDVAKGSWPLQQGGAFDGKIDLPGTLNLGYAQVILSFGEGGHEFSRSLRVEEFRRPEFESTTSADAGPHFVGGHALVETAARYYAGGALPGADVQWQVTATPGQFDPPGCEGYVFGRQMPWWMRGWGGRDSSDSSSQNLASRLSSSGEHSVRLDFDRAAPPQPWSVAAHATVMDVNRQAWSSQAALLVHPAAAYVGLQLERTFGQAGQAMDIGLIAADLDGKRLVGAPVSLRMFRRTSDQVAGEWQEKLEDLQTCEWSSTAQPGRCGFTPKTGGMWSIEATVKDAQGRINQTIMQVYVSGGDAMPERGSSEDAVRLVPDRQEYAPGQTAKVLVIAPWPGAEAEVTLAREGRISRQHLRMEGLSAAVDVPIEDAHTPGLHIHVALVGQAPRRDAEGRVDSQLPPRPARASGSVYLAVPPTHRTLQVALTPKDPIAAPGQKTSIQLQVRDAQGQPAAGAEVLLVLADESVLALTGYRIASPLETFYPQRGDGVVLHELRQWLLLAALPALRGSGGVGMASGSGRGGGGGGKGMLRMKSMKVAEAGAMMDDEAVPRPSPAAPMREAKEEADSPGSEPQPAIAVRKDFNPLALFAPAVVTDAQGLARVELTLPDNLTRYRIMAVASQGAKAFGQGESLLTARLPLMVKPSAPRFANFGDRFELPVVLQNQTDQPLQVKLAARSTVLKVAGQGMALTVPANNRVEVRLPTEAPSAGTGRVQIAVDAGGFSDAAEISLPVWTPATTEGFATYGVLDDGSRAQGIRKPQDVVVGFGGLSVTTSSTALQGLTDAVLYLLRYPFECSEQRASRMLSIAALRDVLQAFGSADLPSDAAIQASMLADLKALERLQNGDGGFGFWRRGERSWPINTLHVAHALVRAKQKGYAVPEQMLTRVLNYTKHIDRHFADYYSVETRRVLRALALYVRLQAGQRDVPMALALIGEVKKVEELPLEALGWLWPVLSGQKAAEAQVLAIRTHVANRVEEQAGAAHFTTRYADGAHLLLASDRRADAILLDALMTDQPQSDVIPKLVTGLLAHRKKGRWGSTQENSWVLLALDRYFRTYEKATPDFVARLWLGDQYAGEQQFKGRQTERREVKVPMALLAAGPKDVDLIVQKQGPGRLYYRIGLDYAPASLKLGAMDRGFAVQRSYRGLDKPADVRQDPDGTWRIRAGARVEVRVVMVAAARRYHVALVDPLPAGLEAISGDLLGAQPPPPQQAGPPSGHSWRWGRWYEHDNLRDERAEAFTSLLWDGEYEYVYTCRATTPGAFVVPPAKAEEMYSPEVFGRSASDRVVVE